MIFQEEKICLFSSQYWDFHWKWLFLAKHIFDQLEHTDLIGLNIKELQNPTVICGHSYDLNCSEYGDEEGPPVCARVFLRL